MHRSHSENEPFFSVIIPTYNRAMELKRALESLVSQTYKKFEVIVCDDGSTDNTQEIANSFSRLLDLKYIREENWGGPARPRNCGLRSSTGEWVCFLDADDWWYPDRLEVVSANLHKGDVLYHHLDIYTLQGKKRHRRSKGRRLSEPVFIDLIVNGNAITNSSAVVKKELLEKVGGLCEEKSLIAVEDYDLWLKLGKITNKFHYIPDSLGGYWVDDMNITEISARQIERIESVYQRHLPDIEGKYLREADAFRKYWIGGIYYRMGLMAEARPLMAEARHVRSPILKLKSYYFRFAIFVRSIRKSTSRTE